MYAPKFAPAISKYGTSMCIKKAPGFAAQGLFYLTKDQLMKASL